MKGFTVRIVHVSLLAVSIAAINHGGWSAYCQTPAPTPSASPTQEKTASAPNQQGTTERERRSQAYAKLLEGQRYLGEMRRTGSNTTLRQARQAFQDAATLDPTLAEAHTALAEIAFYFPPQDFDTAAREGAYATRLSPDNFGAHRLLARLFTIKSGLRDGTLNRSAADAAIRELKHVTRLDKNNAEGWALLGEFYYATGKTVEALDSWTQWAAAPASSDTRFFQYITGRELSPDAAAARLGEALLSAGRGTEALVAVRRAMALDPDNRDYAELLGRIIEGGGLDEKVVAAELQRLAAADRTDPDTAQRLAHIQARVGRVDEAATTLRAAMARLPKGDRAVQGLRAALAKIFVDALRYPDAIAVYEEQLKEYLPGDAPLTDDSKVAASRILSNIIEVYSKAGRPNDVSATIERMRRLLGADDPMPEMQQVVFLREQGKKEEALKAVRAARQRFPEQTSFTRLEAQTLADLGRVDEGVAVLRAQMKGTVDDFEEHLFISALYLESARAPEAVAAAKKALDLAPPASPDMVEIALVTLSSAQERAGDTKGAEESLRRILAKDPDNATALNNLGYFLVERNERLPEALQMIQRAVRSNPTNSSFLDSLGWAFFKLGKLEEAERHLADAARRNNTSATIQEHLGDVYAQQRKADLARAAWEKALSLASGTRDVERLKAKLATKNEE